MASFTPDPDLLRLLRALGMPERCTKFVLVVDMDNGVRARATFFPEVDSAVPVTKTYKLVEK